MKVPLDLPECQALQLLHDAVPVLRGLAAQVEQLFKVGADGPAVVGRRIPLQHVTARAGGGLEEGGRPALSAKDRHHGRCRRAFSLAIAAARGLQDGIQPRLFPIDGGKVDVHARLDQRGGHHAAGNARPQALPDLPDGLPAVRGRHQRRQVIGALSAQQVIDRARLRAGVDDAQRLLVPVQPTGQLLIRQQAGTRERDAPEGVKVYAGADLPCRSAGQELRKEPAERGLRGRAQDGCDAIALHQLGNCVHAGAQIGQRQHLRFVEDDDAARDVVQLAAAARMAGEQRLKELHGRRHDDGAVPVLDGLRLADLLRRGLVADVVQRAAVMLQHVFPAEDLRKLPRVLLDDGRVGQHVDHAPQAVRPGVAQRKGQ